jgi:hypothetical protein
LFQQSSFRPSFRIIGAVALAFLLAACTPSAPRPIRIRSGEELSQSESAAFVEKLKLANEKIAAGRLLATTRLESYGQKQEFRQVIVYAVPDKLRVEFLLPGIQQTSLIIVAHDGRLDAYDAKERKHSSGAASRKNLERLLSLPFETEEIMLWLAGSPLPVRLTTASRIELERSRDASEFLLSVIDSDRETRLLYQSANGEETKLQALEILVDSERVFVSKRQDLQNDFWVISQRVKGSIRTEQFEPLATAPREQLFTLRIPSSAVKVDLDGGDSL